MTAVETPAWCRWRRGRSQVLVIAPHGGRRPPLPGDRPPVTPRTRKVNDLHTADLAEELATALDASLVVNPSIDRNLLDLNRISQVTGRAAWFAALIEMLLADILEDHAHAEVLVVHGWNVIQPKCDIGIGISLPDAAAAARHRDRLTVSPSYAATRLAALAAHCAALGIGATFGARYPARHPNNLLQLFRHHAEGPLADTRLAAWAGAGRVEAVQLELGVPLRWPGPFRRTFLRAAADVFAAPADGGHESAHGTAAPAIEPAAQEAGASLQFYDQRADVALTARIDRIGPFEARRLLLFLGRDRLALFIGEDPRHGAPPDAGPHFTATADGFRLRFSGPALLSSRGDLYVDLEQGFAASELCAVSVDLTFRRSASDEYGAVAGWVAVDDERHPIDTHGFARHGVLQGPPGGWTCQLALSAAFGARRALRLRHEFPGTAMLRQLTPDGEMRSAPRTLSICFDGDRYTPARIVIGDAVLCCEPVSRMAITRPLPPHRVARVTFGAARFTCDGAEGFGFYEYARALG